MDEEEEDGNVDEGAVEKAVEESSFSGGRLRLVSLFAFAFDFDFDLICPFA